jgi:hypothetical protein
MSHKVLGSREIKSKEVEKSNNFAWVRNENISAEEKSSNPI